MAREDVVIRIVAEGEQSLTRIQNSFNRLQQMINRINSSEVAIDDRRMSKALIGAETDAEKLQLGIAACAEKIKRFAKESANVNNILKTTTASLKDQANAFGQIAANAKIGGELFNDALTAQQRFTSKSARSEISRLKVLKDFYEVTRTLELKKGGTREVNLGMEELGRMQRAAFGVDSIAAIKAWKSEVESAFEVVGGGSPVRGRLEEMLTAADRRLSQLAIQKPQREVNLPASPYASSKIKTAAADMAAYKFSLQREAAERKIERIAQNIDMVQLDTNSKLMLRNKLDEASVRVKEGNLGLAREIAKETDRETRDLVKNYQMLSGIEARRKAIQANWGISLSKASEISSSMRQIAEEDQLKMLSKIEARRKAIQANWSISLSKALEISSSMRQTTGEDQLRIQKTLASQQNVIKTLINDINTARLKGVDLTELEGKLLADIALLEKNQVDASQASVNILGRRIKDTRVLLGLAASEIRLKNEANRKSGGPSGSTPEQLDQVLSEIEARRKVIQANWSISLSKAPEISSSMRQTAAKDQLRIQETLASQQNIIKTLINDVNTAKLKGVDLTELEGSLLADIALLEKNQVDASQANVNILEKRIRVARVLLGLAASEIRLKNEANKKSGGPSGATPEQLELRRLNQLNSVITLQGRIMSLEANGVEMSAEKVRVEGQILNIKNLQNQADQKALVLSAIEMSDLRNSVALQERFLKSQQGSGAGAGGATMFGGIGSQFKQKFSEMFPRGANGKRGLTEAGFENLALGTGFPLMFGGGPGTIAGGAIGSFFGKGFGGQILGGAIGQILDQSIASVKALNDAFLTAGDSYSSLRQTGVEFSAELERQVMAAKAIGDFQKAKGLAQGSMLQYGDIGGAGTSGTTATVQLLQNAWNGVYKTVSITLGILASPFIAALSLILRIVQGIFAVVNFILTGIGTLILKIPALGAWIEKNNAAINESTAAYQDLIAELNKESVQLSKTLEIKNKILDVTLGTFGTSQQNVEIEKRKADYQARQLELNKKIEEIRQRAPLTASGERKADELIAKEKMIFLKEELTASLGNAQALYQEIYNHNIDLAKQKEDQEIQYREMQRDSAMQQAAINLEVARKVEDMALERRAKELDFIKRKKDAEIEAAKLAAGIGSYERQLGSALRGTTAEDQLLNNVQTAIDQWRIGREKIENETRDKQLRTQLELRKGEIEMQRYKEDGALRIAKMNYDSQKQIAAINLKINRQNDELERKRFSMRIQAAAEEMKVAQANLNSTNFMMGFMLQNTPAGSARDFYQQAYKIGREEVERLNTEIKAMEALKPAAPLSNVGALPAFTMNTGAAAAQYEANKQLIQSSERQLTAQEEQTALGEENFKLRQAVTEEAINYVNELGKANREYRLGIEYQTQYRNLVRNGILPDLAEQRLVQRRTYDEQQKNLDGLIAKLNQLKQTPEITNILKDLANLKAGGTEQFTQSQINLEERFSPVTRLKDEIAKVEESLTMLMDPAYQVAEAAKSIGSAFSDSFKGIASGSMSAQEALANFFQKTANHFLEMAAQIVAQQTVLKLLNYGLSFLSGFAGAGAGGAGIGTTDFSGAIAIGGARAYGGPVNAYTPYMVGEKGPELFVPSSSGNIVPNSSLGGGSVSVMVNVDAKGSQVQGDDAKSSELGRLIAASVQQELVKQQRPGGILAR